MRHLKANAGTSGIVRCLFVFVILTLVAVKGGGLLASLLWAASLVVGWLVGKWLALAPEQRHRYLQGLGGFLLVGAFVTGAARRQLDVNEDLLLFVVISAVGLYISAFVSFMSDRRVEISHS